LENDRILRRFCAKSWIIGTGEPLSKLQWDLDNYIFYVSAGR